MTRAITRVGGILILAALATGCPPESASEDHEKHEGHKDGDEHDHAKKK